MRVSCMWKLRAAAALRSLLAAGAHQAAPAGNLTALATVMILLIGISFGSTPAAASCSTITGPGLSSGGPCPTQHRVFTAPSSGYRSTPSTTYYYSSGGGGGVNYGAAAASGLAAGAALIEAAPGIFNTVESVLGGVVDAGTGIAGDIGDAAGGVADDLGSSVAGYADDGDSGAAATATSDAAFNDGSWFNIFAPQRDVPCSESDREHGCRNIRGNAAHFGDADHSGDSNCYWDEHGRPCHPAGGGGKRKLTINCDHNGCYRQYVDDNSASENTHSNDKANRLRDQLRKRLAESAQQAQFRNDIEHLERGHVGKAAARAALEKTKRYSKAQIDKAMRTYHTRVAETADSKPRQPHNRPTNPAKTDKPKAHDQGCAQPIGKEFGWPCESKQHFLDRLFGGHLTQ